MLVFQRVYTMCWPRHIYEKNCSNPTGIPLFRFRLKAPRMCLIPNGDQKEQHDKISSFNYHHFSDYIKKLWSFKVSPIFQSNPHECETIKYRRYRNQKKQVLTSCPGEYLLGDVYLSSFRKKEPFTDYTCVNYICIYKAPQLAKLFLDLG